MSRREMERRACERFVIPGASVSYMERGLFSAKKFSSPLPLFDISRGGLRFLSQNFLKIGAAVSLSIVIPGEEAPITVKGTAAWISPNPEKSYKYQIGIQFDPYGEGEDYNDPEILRKLADLEEKYKNI